jgi:hypothetical protein
MRRGFVRGILVVAGIGWAGGLVLGVHRLAQYEGTPGQVSKPLDQWPADGPARNADGYTLTVFVHPECPCSLATLSSLDKIMGQSGGRARAYVFAAMPVGAPADWHSAVLLEKARAIAGVTVVEDAKGHFCREFGAMTSGQTAMYDVSGSRVFFGGITDGRGHEGPNAGLSGVESILHGHSRTAAETPVFGCSLLGD